MRKSVVALAIIALAPMFTAVTATAASAASCYVPSRNAPAGGGFAYDGVSIRTGPYTACTRLGLGYTSQSVTYHCYASGDTVDGWSTWTYLTDNSTGVNGWTTDAYLNGHGSLTHC